MKNALKVFSIVLLLTLASCKGNEKVIEKTSFDVVLTEVGVNKLAVVKVVKFNTDLSLKDSKDLVESAPKTVKTGLTKDEAEKLKKAFELEGAKAEIK